MAAGSIKRRRYKRVDGSTREVWRAQHPDPTRGGAHKIERQFPTKREAEQWMTEQRAAVQRGEWINPADGERTFSAVAGEWRETWADLEAKTQAGYESILGALEERFGRARVATLTTDAIQRYVNELAEQRATNTVRRYFTVLSSVMRVAVERRYIASNPCASVRLPRRREPRPERLFLTPEEVAAVAEAVPPHWRVLVYTAAYTGLRAGELCGLRRKRLDVLRGTIRVEESLKEVGGRLVFGEPKSAAGRRTVSLPKSICDLLAEHLAVAAPGGNGPEDLVFTTTTGKPIRHNLFYKRIFKPAVERALPAEKHALRFHDLRHTCASLSLAVAPNLHAVKERLGHEDIRTTINTYGHLVPSVDAALSAGLDQLFAEAAEGDLAKRSRSPA
jgi:integrase